MKKQGTMSHPNRLLSMVAITVCSIWIGDALAKDGSKKFAIQSTGGIIRDARIQVKNQPEMFVYKGYEANLNAVLPVENMPSWFGWEIGLQGFQLENRKNSNQDSENLQNLSIITSGLLAPDWIVAPRFSIGIGLGVLKVTRKNELLHSEQLYVLGPTGNTMGGLAVNLGSLTIFGGFRTSAAFYTQGQDLKVKSNQLRDLTFESKSFIAGFQVGI
jgi:hypothetical protein